MKKILLIFSIFLITISCKAQTQTIIPMNSYYNEIPEGSYFKDTENFLDSFVGTWKYQNGNEQFVIILNKKLKHDYEGRFKDILYGEYKYVNLTGNTVVNTLNKINQPMDESDHMISGATFIDNTMYVKCNDCNLGEWRIMSFFEDPDRKNLSINIIFRFINSSTIKIKIYRSGPAIILDQSQIDQPDKPQVPLGEYIMTKQ